MRGFTLLELLLVIGLVAVLTAFVVPNYRFAGREMNLQRSLHKLTQDFRRTQEMAISAQEFNGLAVSAGYGIYFVQNQGEYAIFADLNADKSYNPDLEPQSETVEIVEMEPGVTITGLEASPLTIIFIPPDPAVFITGNRDSVTIALNAKRSIKVYKTGLVAIE